MTFGPGRFMATLRDDPPAPTLAKPASRLEDKKAERKLAVVDEKAFKGEIWKRDKAHCRCCKRKVVKVLGRVPERGEVHHLHGRTGDLRFDARFALLVCLTCHEKLTGRVAEKWIATPAAKGGGTVTLPGTATPLTDARLPVEFERAA